MMFAPYRKKQPIFSAVWQLFFLFSALFLGAETAEGIFPEDEGNPAVPIWRQAPGGAVIGIPSIQAGTVVAVLEGGHLRAYSLDGKPLWNYYARGKLVPYVSRAREGTCYICRTDGTLIAVNRSGRELWQISTGPITAQVLVGWDGRIFVTTEELIRCYTASGYLLWSRELEHRIGASPVLSKTGGITAILENGDLLELSPFGKAEKQNIGGTPAGLVAADSGVLVLLRTGEIKLCGGGSVRSLGTLRAAPLGGVSRNNTAAILLSGGSVVEISLADGKQQWTAETHIRTGDTQSPEAFDMLRDERGIYVFSSQGAAGFSDAGRRLWLLRLNGASSIPALSEEGTLVSGGTDWILYAYKLEDRVLPRRQSLYGPAPEGNYGLINPPPSPWADDYFRFNEEQMREELAKLTLLIQEGRVGEEEPVYAAYLREISGSATNPQTSQTHPPVHVRRRAEAAGLLGYFGSRETIAFLADLYTRDPDPTVKSAAAEAIGRIGTDPDGIALQTFARTITSTKDEQVLAVTAQAIGSLCRFSGPPLSESGIKLLGILERDFMPPKARAQAKREIASLR
ncbi:MAG: PQQ-binding-like beta-propeller repeat protein [Spirochaetaceae bacterium]|nr:PQQ-binding-like beta-propeller repeat protein [Spirochaetaceae bacterium]